MRIVDDDRRRRTRRSRELHDRGLILDIGHGTGSFSFETAEAMLAQGILPDVISSDIHQMAIQGPMFDLPTTLSKFLNLGMSLPDVIERATARAGGGDAPAGPRVRCEPGSAADVALFRIEEGDYTFQDVFMKRAARRPDARQHADDGRRRGAAAGRGAAVAAVGGDTPGTARQGDPGAAGPTQARGLGGAEAAGRRAT